MQAENANYFFKIQESINVIASYCHHAVLTGLPINNTQQLDNLYFQFLLKPLQNIRLNEQNPKNIIRLSLQDVYINIKACKSSNQFIYEEGIYKNNIIIEMGYENEKPIELQKKQIKIGQWSQVIIVIPKTRQFQKAKWTLQNCLPVIEIGSLQKHKAFENKIKKIILSNRKQTMIIEQNRQNIRLCDDGPLDTIPNTQIPDVDKLPEYHSIKQKQDKLYLCHDMQGGYKQDTNKFQTYPSIKSRYNDRNRQDHTYRCLHLPQASIFNYFSHYLVTIPPEHWRRLCKKANTLCLGTYIVEREQPKQTEYLTQYTAKMLVYFCRKYRFDGYLINFEKKIYQVNNLKNWLKSLSQKIHKAVPGSKLIWYDSINATTGQVNWQNQLNTVNLPFYEICDGIFLNYWWKQYNLLNCVHLYNKEQVKVKKPIYVGSDCFGRRTFGGGKFDTYKAIAAMSTADKGNCALWPALFAMGYTYETQKNTIHAWKIHEKSLYRGMKFKKIQLPHNSWKQTIINKQHGYSGWNLDGQCSKTWNVQCSRRKQLNLKHIYHEFQQKKQDQDIILAFYTKIQKALFYKITVSLEIQGFCAGQQIKCESFQHETSKVVQVKMFITSDVITQGLKLIITQQVGDNKVQNIRYNRPTGFKNDTLYFIIYNRKNDWASKIKTSFSKGLNIPYLTNYNLGHGKFNIYGKNTSKSHDYLSDNDLGFTYLMNHPKSVQICYTDAYMGGTCLLVQQTKKIKLIQLMIEKQRNIRCRVVVKCQKDKMNYELSYRLNDNNNKLDKGKYVNRKDLPYNWKQLNFQIQLDKQLEGQHKLTLFLQTTGDELTNYLIGQTAVYQAQYKANQDKILSLRLEASDLDPPTPPVYYDMYLQMSGNTKVLITVDDQFSCFGYADELNSNKIIIKNVHSKARIKQSNIVIHILDAQLRYKPIYNIKVNNNQLAYKQVLVLI